MPAIHRNNDARSCGAKTQVQGQTTVFMNGELVSVQDDPNTHGAGNLKADNNDGSIRAGGKTVVLVGSNSDSDNQSHNNSAATGGSPDIFSNGVAQ